MADPKRSGFPVPPEVSAYFRDKNLKPAFSWQDLWGEEHAYNFTVAKAVDAELLKVFQDSLQRAIDEGQSFETWRDQLRPELERLGWWGKRMVADPTGKSPDKAVDFSSPRRLQNIFWSNVRSARAAGQWERAQRSKRALPFLLYVRTTSAEPRVEHLAWVGIILPVDHEFWRTHFPPNGWGCKCSVRQISKREAERLLGEPGYTSDVGDFLRKTTYVNKRTGQVTQEPVGIDPGWGTNPGLSRAETLVDNLTAKLDAAGPEVAKKVVEEWMASPTPKILLGIDKRLQLPVAVAPAVQQTLGARSAIVVVSNDTMRTKDGKHAAINPSDFAGVQGVIDDNPHVERPGRKPPQVAVFHERGDNLLQLVIARSRAGYLYVKTLFATGADKAAKRGRPKE
ncbi:MAG: phage minor head protein [Rhodoblastus sp.]